MKYKRKIEKEFISPIEYGFDIFGGRWKSQIICTLSAQKSMRYGEIREKLNNISDAVLSAMLKELIENELVERVQFNEIPLRVEYNLSEKGKSLIPVLQNICEWSNFHSKEELAKNLAPCKTCPRNKKK